ncbi:hypothetical protein XHC_4163 [Xanthomonas hortorum pv. carotae str. M081]|nr:hypothetical protein XHC_4163 [Xanthomonas hortorum pv. carotae str. M081]
MLAMQKTRACCCESAGEKSANAAEMSETHRLLEIAPACHLHWIERMRRSG